MSSRVRYYVPGKGPRRVMLVETENGRRVRASVPAGVEVTKGMPLLPSGSGVRRRGIPRWEVEYERRGEQLHVQGLRTLRRLMQWQPTKDGDGVYRFAGWWQKVRCRACREVRYVYPRIGMQFRRFGRDGASYLRSVAFKNVGANELTFQLWPRLEDKPELVCRCGVEP